MSDPARDRAKGGQPTGMNAAAPYLGYGLTWALSTGLFLAGGWLLDRWLGTLPLFLLVGTFVGAGAGFYSLYYHLVIEPRERAKQGDGRGSEDAR